MKEIYKWSDGTEGNGIWQSEGVVRRFKTAQYDWRGREGERVKNVEGEGRERGENKA
jgi:hypothetical protein